MAKNDKREILINNSDIYDDYLLQKKIKNITQYASFDFKNLNTYLKNIKYVIHKIENGESLYTISAKYYDDPSYSWLICYTNKVKNELELKVGDSIKIYFPLYNLIGVLNG
jgi:hypothetical protein